MNEKLNLVEILKDCPKGMELDCTVYNDVTFLRVDDVQNRCYFKAGPADTFWTTCEGRINGSPYGKCVVFPKGKTTWEGFKPKKPKFDPKTLQAFDKLTEPTYRPFKDREECWNEMLKHQPLGWLLDKDGNEDTYKLLNYVGENGASTGYHNLYFKELFELTLFADGTPFGIKED